ncbi:glutamate mutase subunit S [Actinokineospora alba]|uniref:Glutamate mutase subunit S n=1 Tax=Actinokineospora alba TaxID=504798 RepID=A0A1H0NJD8_9PSEU|nr:cobalamin-dependent protein [Actinokineospora alba]TDP68740.1 methylaspartate mutase sigma subunit [Actinokineospora alba]SDH85593.1 methylaspartate mutase sigma subunit [Actinokineospora alba]SDO92741.1 glutamate mutase subunit S [Actinokineospora alba]
MNQFNRATVILGVAASDAHAVANILIAESLREAGFLVVNLGVCTPLPEFAEAYQANPTAVAVVVGSLNGHAYDDLRDLPALRARGLLGCPVVVGGNISVGSTKSDRDRARLEQLGVDHVLDDVAHLVPLLAGLAQPVFA